MKCILYISPIIYSKNRNKQEFHLSGETLRMLQLKNQFVNIFFVLLASFILQHKSLVNSLITNNPSFSILYGENIRLYEAAKKRAYNEYYFADFSTKILC